MRRGRVRVPRRASQASKAPRVAPPRRAALRRGSSSASSAATTPAVRSPWPPRYLVTLCTTACAPRARGRQRYGVAKVLSTTSLAPPSRAIWATAGRSTRRSRGLLTVSTNTTRGRRLATAAATAAVSVASTRRRRTPALAMMVEQQGLGGPVQVPPGHDRIPRGDPRRQQHPVNRGHPRRERHRPRRPLQRRHRQGQGVGRRRPVAGVDVALGRVGEGPLKTLQALEGEARAGLNPRGHGAP